MAEMQALTITNLEAVITKLRLEPGDCLVIKTNCCGLREESRELIRRTVEESFGCTAMVLPAELTLEDVLNVPPEMIERARGLGRKRQEEFMLSLRERFKAPSCG